MVFSYYDRDQLAADAAAAGLNFDDDKLIPLDCHGFYHEPEWIDTAIERRGGVDRIVSLDTLPNTEALLRALGVIVRYNMMTRLDEYSGGIVDGKTLNSAVTRIISAGKSRGYKSSDIYSHLSEIALINQYHPVREWVASIQWDGKSRIAELANTLHADDSTLAELMIKRWAIGAMQAVLSDKPQSQQGVLVLLGEQGTGKTTWIKSLCPLSNAILTGAELDPHKPDSVQKCTSAWITELGEVDGTMRRSDVATLKAFVTEDKDIYRMPYARMPREYPRRTAFAASVNDENYLVDQTGNRRWWTIKVSQIDQHNINAQQFWAEIAALVAAGESHALQSSELLAVNENNRKHEVVDPYQEQVLVQYGHCQSVPPDAILTPMTATEIAESLGYRQPDQRTVKAVGSALRVCGYLKKQAKIRGVPLYGYRMPQKRMV